MGVSLVISCVDNFCAPVPYFGGEGGAAASTTAGVEAAASTTAGVEAAASTTAGVGAAIFNSRGGSGDGRQPASVTSTSERLAPASSTGEQHWRAALAPASRSTSTSESEH